MENIKMRENERHKGVLTIACLPSVDRFRSLMGGGGGGGR